MLQQQQQQQQQHQKNGSLDIEYLLNHATAGGASSVKQGHLVSLSFTSVDILKTT